VSTLGFVNVYNIGGFFANPGIREVFPAVGVPAPEPEEPVAPATPVTQEPVALELETQEIAYRVHTVVSGDSLYRIARNLLGNGNRWGEIFELNRDVIRSSNLIHIGWQLRIPA